MPSPFTILDATDIDLILNRMTHEILESHRGIHNIGLIGIQTRGVYLARRIQVILDKIEGAKVPTGIMDITLYRDDWMNFAGHPIVRQTDIPFAVDGRHVILVDDVLFTGRTVRAAMDAVMDFGRPARIELVVLIDRGHRELPIQGNYVGKRISTPREDTVRVRLAEHDQDDKVEILPASSP
jgi:pyrimidine operon attenuation protein/uracil phosphoribosyltransferase